MDKLFSVLGLMSGTSSDGIDASIIKTNGRDIYESLNDYYFEYPDEIICSFNELKDKIKDEKDLIRFNSQINDLERKYTLLNSQFIKEILFETKPDFELIGFHGQTIYHNAEKKISKQIGNADLLSKLTKKKVVFEFRKNDLLNGGQGAPLTPIFHKIIAKNLNLFPCIFLNLGGISNVTTLMEPNKFTATDLGPGMCLIDKWVRLNSNEKFDKDGKIGSNGKVSINLNYALDNFYNSQIEFNKDIDIKSFDINDFDISFLRGLSLQDGVATLVEYTTQIISDYYRKITLQFNEKTFPKLIICGGGRKNSFLIKRLKLEIKKNNKEIDINKIVKLIDDYGINGDYVESQAFAYLAVRSVLSLPLSFPHTTGCKKPVSGGIIFNY